MREVVLQEVQPAARRGGSGLAGVGRRRREIVLKRMMNKSKTKKIDDLLHGCWR